jgi:hypothetical protein
MVFAAVAAAACPASAENSRAEHPLSFMFGEWAGAASGTGRGGERFEVTQTERVGPMLNGDVVVIEGRGYEADGKLVFNAFGIVSRKAGTDEWEMRSYTGGHAGTFPFEARADGYTWTLPAGPSAVVRYTATFKDGVWHQTGDYVPAEGEPRRTFEMTLKRLGDTNWPASGYVKPPK